MYTCDSAWVDSGKVATLHNIPGTPALGQFNVTDGVERWDIYNPNGLLLYGKRSSPEVWVAANACPWSLSTVTSASGALYVFISSNFLWFSNNILLDVIPDCPLVPFTFLILVGRYK